MDPLTAYFYRNYGLSRRSRSDPRHYKENDQIGTPVLEVRFSILAVLDIFEVFEKRKIPSGFDIESEREDSPTPRGRKRNLFGDNRGLSSENPIDDSSGKNKQPIFNPRPASLTTPGQSTFAPNPQPTVLGMTEQIVQELLNILKETREENKELRKSRSRQSGKELSDHDVRKDTLDRITQKARDYLPAKPTVRLNGENYESWHSCIYSEAKLIHFTEVFTEKAPSEDLTPLEKEVWETRREIMHARIISSLAPTIRDRVAEIDSTYKVLEKLESSYSKSPAEDRLSTFIALQNLKVEDGDYHKYEAEYLCLSAKLKKVGGSFDKDMHDIFIRGLGDFNKAFIKTQLDELYDQSRKGTKVLDIRKLMDQLGARTSTRSREKASSNNTKNTKQSANTAVSSQKDKGKEKSTDSSQPTGISKKKTKCDFCKRFYSEICYQKDPANAPNWWKEQNPHLFKADTSSN